MRTGRDWKRSPTLRAFQKDGSLRPLSILVGNGGLFLDFEMERGADGAMTGYAFPDMLVDVVRLSKAGQARCSARSVRCASAADPLRAAAGRGPRGAQICAEAAPHYPSSAQRKPGATITATAKAEVDYLLSRVARIDKRANLQPQASAAE